MTDQEQTERGASTVRTDVEAETSAFAARVVGDLEAEVEAHRQQLTNVTRLVGYWQAEAERLRADLERVTAELQTARSENHGLLADLDMTEKARVEALAERNAMREALLKIEEIASRPSIADEERMSMVWQIVVLSLDAARKATADATEEGK
jgi:chromosome segregation ATPase